MKINTDPLSMKFKAWSDSCEVGPLGCRALKMKWANGVKKFIGELEVELDECEN